MRINFNIQKNKALKGRKEEIRHENQEKEKKKRKEKKNESLKPHKSYIIPTHH
jgi:endonuclease IV